jgi:hypothetical protein
MMMLMLLLLSRVLLLLSLLPFHAEYRIHLHAYIGTDYITTVNMCTYIHDVPPYGTAVDGVCGRRCP